ncbi:putative rRNA methylase (SpoU class) [Hoeflea phototrophica DFL-43]|jgi:tRNA (cytidine/uridine-2'-O-)-methyltransferase|uniref:tRNA (cytidine(34)-2'-O)-methyltransferase n=1 Tax=Hoeflea phototrophica (strain DSM 17068 / NCIMB 14078 / DFL-43) TaxID=411684 RepID=A9DHA9_HOEPD|nr:tRNA (cytidine(34)-2'-O)-methyltransferase [Hoeflea phototrophica]EDQ31510.1 putative rRNA methylase (SpoU class) [Hoeflea phototrophica DFL-43]
MTKPLIALYQPDIPGNTGAIMRLGACMGIGIHIIGPAGFDLSDRALKRAGMDYIEMATLTRHDGWEEFEAWRKAEGRRLVLMTTKSAVSYMDDTVQTLSAQDVVLFGRESVGAPERVHDAADLRLTIPMIEGRRSLNLAMSVAMVAGEINRRFGL